MTPQDSLAYCTPYLSHRESPACVPGSVYLLLYPGKNSRPYYYTTGLLKQNPKKNILKKKEKTCFFCAKKNVPLSTVAIWGTALLGGFPKSATMSPLVFRKNPKKNPKKKVTTYIHFFRLKKVSVFGFPDFGHHSNRQVL